MSVTYEQRAEEWLSGEDLERPSFMNGREFRAQLRPSLAALLRVVAAEEREACAKECDSTVAVCERRRDEAESHEAKQVQIEQASAVRSCARRIRARGDRR